MVTLESRFGKRRRAHTYARHVTGQWCRLDTRAFGVVVHTDTGDQWSRPHVHIRRRYIGVSPTRTGFQKFEGHMTPGSDFPCRTFCKPAARYKHMLPPQFSNLKPRQFVDSLLRALELPSSHEALDINLFRLAEKRKTSLKTYPQLLALARALSFFPLSFQNVLSFFI